jgi:hypothetical protein
VLIFSRGCLPELKESRVDRNGRLIESWEQHNKLFVRPHRMVA